MNRFKDFIYDKSDIVVALVIISIAGVIIFTRIDAILSYPEIYAAKANSATGSAVVVDYVDTTPEAINESPTENPEETLTEEPVEMYAVYINYGESLQVIADKFVAVGLFATSEDFFAAVEAASAGTQIKTGNFIIPSNATPEEVIELITKPGL